MNFDQTQLTDLTFVAFDTETTGAYPLGNEIVEFGAVKFKVRYQNDAQILLNEISNLQILLKPSRPMSQFNMSIHGITNEMVENCDSISERIGEIYNYLGDAILIAHHAPFDMGFMAIEFEKHDLIFPNQPVLCSSLLARSLIPESTNHKLQTLISFLKIPGGQAHRALDDARACAHVAVECFRRLGTDATLKSAVLKMKKTLLWDDYRLLSIEDSLLKKITTALQEGFDLKIKYKGGHVLGQWRFLTPQGIVRNPDGDYISAICHIDRGQKRFYLSKISEIEMVSPQVSL